jgi:predicted N-acetyltransferase YhbS
MADRERVLVARDRLRVLIRAPRADDAPAVALLLGQLGYPAGPTTVARRLERLAADPELWMRVAVSDGAVIGLGAVSFIAVLEGDRSLAALITLIVDECERLRGVGSALVRAIELEARARGSFGIAVLSGQQRIGAHAFYERLDYQLTGERILKLFSGEGA